jgi:hypothetical protein
MVEALRSVHSIESARADRSAINKVVETVGELHVSDIC